MTTSMDDRLQAARAHVQELHDKLETAHHKTEEEMRAELSAAGTKAHQLSATVKALAEAERADFGKNLAEAADSLQQAAATARAAANEKRGEMKARSQAALSEAREALQKLSETVAARRRDAKTTKV